MEDPFQPPEDLSVPNLAPSIVVPGLPPDLCETARLLSLLLVKLKSAERIEHHLADAMRRAFQWGYAQGGVTAVNHAEELLRKRAKDQREYDIGGES